MYLDNYSIQYSQNERQWEKLQPKSSSNLVYMNPRLRWPRENTPGCMYGICIELLHSFSKSIPICEWIWDLIHWNSKSSRYVLYVCMYCMYVWKVSYMELQMTSIWSAFNSASSSMSMSRTKEPNSLRRWSAWPARMYVCMYVCMYVYLNEWRSVSELVRFGLDR